MKANVRSGIVGIGLAAGLWGGEARVVTMQEAGAKLSAVKPDAHGIRQYSLGQFGAYSMSVTRREASGVAEVHKAKNDFFVVESGECTLVTGGAVIGPRTTAPGEVRGSSIQGGERRRIAQGDVVHIPANVPHQMLLDAGGQITYAVVKTRAQ